MRIYQFHFIGRDGARPLLDFSDCADDGTAAREAFGQLRQHRSALGVEVWEGERMVLHVDPTAEGTLAGGQPLRGGR